MRPRAVLLLAWWFVMHATSGNGTPPVVAGPFQDKQACDQERFYWSQRGFLTSQQCFQG